MTEASALRREIARNRARRVEMRKALGHELRQWRESLRISQTTAGAKAGITQACLSNYETGRREAPHGVVVLLNAFYREQCERAAA